MGMGGIYGWKLMWDMKFAFFSFHSFCFYFFGRNVNEFLLLFMAGMLKDN